MSAPDDASGYSRTDLISCGFIHTPELKALVEDTRPVADLDVAAFDTLAVAGGQAPMFTFELATDLHRVFAAFLEIGKVAAALCHGVAVLAHARDSDGELLARGRTVTGFANVEKDYADDAVWSCGLLPRDRNLMPWRIEDRLKAIGANDVQAGLCVGATTSGAEQFAALAVGTRVVKAFNTTGAENMADSSYAAGAPMMPVCGDDAEARHRVLALATLIGFEAVDFGALMAARYLEPMAMAWIHLADRQGHGRRFAFALLRVAGRATRS